MSDLTLVCHGLRSSLYFDILLSQRVLFLSLNDLCFNINDGQLLCLNPEMEEVCNEAFPTSLLVVAKSCFSGFSGILVAKRVCLVGYGA